MSGRFPALAEVLATLTNESSAKWWRMAVRHASVRVEDGGASVGSIGGLEFRHDSVLEALEALAAAGIVPDDALDPAARSWWPQGVEGMPAPHPLSLRALVAWASLGASVRAAEGIFRERHPAAPIVWTPWQMDPDHLSWGQPNDPWLAAMRSMGLDVVHRVGDTPVICLPLPAGSWNAERMGRLRARR